MLRKPARWQSSASHLLLLTKFVHPQPGDYPCNKHWGQAWAEVLQEPVQQAIKHFIAQKMIAPANTAESLDAIYKVTELGQMLRERSLKVSGKKDVLIARLIEADPKAMAAIAAKGNILICTTEGRAAAEIFTRQQEIERATVEKSVVSALERGDFHEASRLVAAFEAQQVFGRGLGIDWARHDTTLDAEKLRIIYSAHPGILRRVPANEMPRLRLAAAWMSLWGTSRVDPALLPSNVPGVRFDPQTAARMLMFYASHKIELGRLQQMGFAKGVTILSASDSCEHCRSLAGRFYLWGEVPELPHPDCEHPMGCRCQYISSSRL